MPPSLRTRAACAGLSFLFERADQILRHFPGREPFVRGGVPPFGKFRTLPEADLAPFGFDDACRDQAVDGRVLRPAQGFRHAEGAFVHGVLLEPGHGPASLGVEFAFLLGEDFVETTG